MQVSLIINCFNGSKFLKKTLDSILLLNYKNFEIIFYDNCSTDNSISILKSYKFSNLFVHSPTKNISLGEARRNAVNLSKGDLICFLDVDDKINNDTLDIYVKYFKKYNYDVIYGGINYIDNNDKFIGKYLPKFNDNVKLKDLLYNFDVNVPSMCFNRKAFFKTNFDSNVKYCEELGIMVDLAIRKSKIISIDMALSSYRVHSESLTSLKLDGAAIDRRYILNKIRDKIILSEKHAFDFAYCKSYYYEALYYCKIGKNDIAKTLMYKTIRYSKIYLLLYIVLNLSPKLWLFLHKLKGRKMFKI